MEISRIFGLHVRSDRPNAKKDSLLRMSSETVPSGESKPAPPQQSKAPASEPKAQAASRFKRPSLKLLIAGLVALVVLIVGVPRFLRGLNTVSTDDAYVNSHVTFVAPRVSGQVERVLVDDNSRVRKGDVLVELDPEPFRVQVAIKQSAVDVAKANLVLAEANVRGLVAQARSQRFKLTHAIEDVDNQVALIRQRVATWEQSKASLVLAQQEFDRAKRLLASKVVSNEEYDQKQAALAVATAQVTQALENVYQARAALACNPYRLPERVSPMCRRISTRRSPRCARPWLSFSRALHNLALCRPRTISRRRRPSMNSTGAIRKATSTGFMPR
jgi:membrane fusion protein (multidrug efflux system)